VRKETEAAARRPGTRASKGTITTVIAIPAQHAAVHKTAES
jgi:hypothetical protein